MIRAFLKDSVIYAIPALVTRGISIFLVPLYTRVLTASDYGSFDLLMIFSNVALLVVAMEISQGVARFYSTSECGATRVRYVSSAFWFTLCCYFLFSIVLFKFAEPLSRFFMGQAGLVCEFYVGVIYIVLNAFFSFLQNQFRWELRARDYAVASFIFSLMSAAGAVFFAYYLRWGLLGLLTGLSIGAALGVAYGVINLRHSLRFQFDWALLREMLAFSLPLVPASLLVVAGIYIDRIMISNLMTIEDVGLFGVGARLAGIVGLLVVGFQGALTPLIYAHYREAKTPDNLAAIFRYFVAIALLVCVSVSLFARDILVLLTTPEYYKAETVVAFLAPAMLLAQMYIFAPGIGIAKKTHWIIWINLLGVAVGVVLNYLLIPVLGIEGAAFSTLACNFIVFVFYVCVSQRLYYVPHRWCRLIVASFLSFLVVFGVTFLELIGWVGWVVNCAVVLALALFFVALDLVSLHDLCLARRMLLRIWKRVGGV
ncbi:MAG: polysaccharide biosynthesis protein [Pseudomonas sp.]|uniref:oligosaccharide flippase family protein n=1 Tax=Pseudomonas sp. FEMGT703P TaxID=2080764 RepID=UPI000CAE6C3E|nr:oligosaccharide flippase family protein [Pseudomonas sp. FEMGT703P]PJE43431.1 MAG: polysaccharide biosynthesis protein [Pseudomonas sp.] [Pseudomonas sp. FEMGT703P]